MTKPKIGFLGLGLMGGAMVECLQKNGYDLVVLGNRDRTHLDLAISRGAVEAQSAREVAERTDIVMFCMGTSDHVESRVYGDDGVLAGISVGKVVVDFGTSLPGSTQKIAQDMVEKGASFLDAPLGRTPAHAVDGLLNIMCAGDKDAYERVLPVLQDLGENVFHLGKSGAGHTVKLMNNFFGMTVACAMSEAFAMADRAGVDRAQLHGVMSAGPLHSGMMDFVKGYAVDGDPNMLEFSIANATKDLGYYRRMAESLGADSVMSSCAFGALDRANLDGRGQQMVSQLVDWFSDNLDA